MFWIATVVGLMVGIFSFPNIILPVLWSWPKARQLERDGKLTKPIPAGLLLLAPVAWAALLAGSFVVVMAAAPSLLSGYVTGLSVGFLKTLWALVSPSDRPQIEAAFADQWREHLR
jgi:hypothetical protein